MTVPYTFGTATSSIPLSQLDSNFATAITLGSTNVYLGNTTTTLVGFANLSSTLITSPTHNSGTTLSLQTGGTTGLYIDASQNVGIGTTSPSYKLDVSGNGRIGSATISASPSTGGAYIELGQDRTGDGVSYIDFHSVASTDYEARIIRNAAANGTFQLINSGTGELSIQQAGAAPITFQTTATERMRIDASGNVLVGTTSVINNGKINSVFDQASASGIGIKNTNASNTGYFMGFYNSSSGLQGAIVQTNSTVTAYLTTSDYRLKNTIAPMQGALEKVALLKPVTYKWNVDGSVGQGFIAHELQAVVPDCVTGEKDAVDAEGKPKYQGIDTSFLVATLTAAIQEMKAIIDEQSVRITALENK